MIRLPETVPTWLIATLAMVTLAALDLGGSFAAKEWVERRSVPMLMTGATLFVVLFWVFASSLQYAELTPVTFGWVVMLQVGVLLLDRFRYQVEMSPGQWVAVVVILVAQAYLMLGHLIGPAETATTSASASASMSAPLE